MKFIKQSLLLLVCALFVVSCADEPLPFDTYDDLQKGAFARKLTDDGGSYFITDPENSSFSFSVEFYGENNGQNVASHEWQIWHRDNVNGTVSEKVVIANVSAGSFGTDPNSGLPTASYTFPMLEALATLGLTIDDVNPGDDLIFDGYVVLNDGRRFGPDNTGASLQGNNGFDGIFRFQKPLLCPSELVGTYDFSTVVGGGTGNGTWDGNVGAVVEGKLRFEEVGDGLYEIYTDPGGEGDVEFMDLSFGAYFGGWGYDPTDAGNQGSMPNTDPNTDGNVRLVDACNKLGFTGSSQWGEVFTFNDVTVNGDVLVLDWTNDYGEAGVTTITRDDGMGWPDFTF